MNITRNQKGFTLIQMVLYMALSSVILFAVSGVLIQTMQLKEKARVFGEVDQQAEFVLHKIGQIVRNASAISAPVSGASASSVTLNVTDVAKDPTVISLVGNKIQITEGAGVAVDLTDPQVNVVAFTVSNVSNPSTPGSLNISLTIAYNNASGRNEYGYSQTFQTTVSLR